MPPWAALLDRPVYDGPISGDEFVAGTPSQVAAELKRQAAAIGAQHVVVGFSPTRPAEIEAVHQRFAAEVLPALA